MIFGEKAGLLRSVESREHAFGGIDFDTWFELQAVVKIDFSKLSLKERPRARGWKAVRRFCSLGVQRREEFWVMAKFRRGPNLSE